MSLSLSQPTGVVLPTTRVPQLLADAAALLTESTSSSVEHAMAAYQRTMLLLVHWYEAGQLEGRELPPIPPTGGGPIRVPSTTPVTPPPSKSDIATPVQMPTPSRLAETSSTLPSAAAIHAPRPPAESAVAGAVARAESVAAVPLAAPLTVAATESPTHARPVASLVPPMSTLSPTLTDTAATAPAKARPAPRPLLPPSTPPLEATPPSDALGLAAREAITRRYGADATDSGA
jgi:hypothetical protein